MPITLFIAESILTRPVRTQAAEQEDVVKLVDHFDPAGYALIETGHIADLRGSRVHQSVGIVLQNRGHVQFLSQVRGDELEDPAVLLRSESITTELLARSTLAGFFGF